MRAPRREPCPASRASWVRRTGGHAWLTLAAWLLCVAWVGSARASDPPPSAPRPAQPSFELERLEPGQTLERGRDNYLAFELTNRTRERWAAGGKVRVAYHLFDPGADEPFMFDGLRTQLPRDLAPGERMQLSVRIDAPADREVVDVQWAVVHESVRWLPGDTGRERFEIVEAAPHWRWEGMTAPSPWPAGDRAEVEVRLKNLGPRAWNPSFGDRVALRWHDAEGTPVELDGSRGHFESSVAMGESTTVRFEAVSPTRDPAKLRQPLRLSVEPLREGVRWYGPSAPVEIGSDWVPVTLAPASLQWEIAGASPTLVVAPDAEVRVPLKIRNVGTRGWGPNDKLSYRIFDEHGVQLAEGPRTSLGRALAPGEQLFVDARVIGADAARGHELRFEMVREGVRWFGPPRSGVAEVRLQVGEPELAWALIEGEAPAWGWAGGEVEVEVTVENRGQSTWSEAAGDRLAYHWLDDEGEVIEREGKRTHFAEPIAPGERRTLRALVHLPREPGRYTLQWEMVREHVRWYGAAEGAGDAAAEAPRVRVVRMGVALQGFLAGLTLFGAWWWRRKTRETARTQWALWGAPVLWLTLVVGAQAVTFNEFAHLHFWSGGRTLSWSGAAIAGACVVFVPGRWRYVVAASIAMVCACVAFVDLVYMYFFGSILPVGSVRHAGHLGEVIDSAITRVRAEQLWLFAPAVAGMMAAWALPAPRRAGVKPKLIALAACGVVATPAARGLAKYNAGVVGIRVFSEQDNVGRMGLFNAHALELIRTVREGATRQRLDEAGRVALRREFHAAAQRRAAQPLPDGWAGVAEGDNLILIQVEALQQWVIDLRVEGQEITPFLNAWHAQGLAYSRIVDQTAQGKTSDAEYLALNSQLPLARGATAFLRANNQFVTLAHVLRDIGYQTTSAHPYRRGFWNRAALHPRYGFSTSAFRRDLGSGINTGWGLADGPFLQRALDRAAELSEPWFAFWVTLSLHHPYDDFPPSLRQLDLGDLEGTALGNYLHAMNYFDRVLAQFFVDLEARELGDHTVVALYGDHDARFEYHRERELLRLTGHESWHPGLPAQLDLVPLFIRVPGGDAPRGRVDQLGGQIDIAPTLASLLGARIPASFAGAILAGNDEAGERVVATPEGRAYTADRVFVPRGREIRAGGACFDFPSGRQRDRGDCDASARVGAELIRQSHASLDADLATWIAGHEGHTAAGAAPGGAGSSSGSDR